MTRLPPISTLFPYTTLFRSQLELFPSDHRLLDEDRVHRTQVETTLNDALEFLRVESQPAACAAQRKGGTNHAREPEDRKSTRLNSSHQIISYAVFCLKKKRF